MNSFYPSDFCLIFYFFTQANSVKGDERRPECKRCEKAGRSCFFSEGPRPSSLDGTALGNSEYFVFPEDHVWVDVPPSGECIGGGNLRCLLTRLGVRFAHQVRLKGRKAGRSPFNVENDTTSSQTSPSGENILT